MHKTVPKLLKGETIINVKFFKIIFGNEHINFRFIKPSGSTGKPVIKSLNGKFNGNTIDLLNQFNQQNFEVYFVPNIGGYKDAEITRINAVFVDLDCGRDENEMYFPMDVVNRFKADKLQALKDYQFKPTFIVETRNGYHAYWLVHDAATVDQFKQCESRLINHFDADKSVRNPANLMRVPGYYWCKYIDNKFMTTVVANNDVRYDIRDIVNSLPEVDDGKDGFGVLIRNNNNTIVSYKDPKTPFSPSNEDMIVNRQIDKLQLLLQPKSITISSHNDVYSYLKKQDLSLFLGITTKYFPCLFHDDRNPSANIYVDPSTGYYWYKCHSGNCGVTRDIISIAEKMLKCSTPEALRFLRNAYKIRFEETPWQKEQKEILEENKRLLYDHERFKLLAPETYNRIRNYLPELIIINDFAAQHVVTENFSDDNGNAVFYVSLNRLAKIQNLTSSRRFRDRVSLFAYLGLINKLADNQIPEFLLKNAVHQAAVNKHKYRKAFYSILSYCDQTLTMVESRAKAFRTKGYSMKGLSREMILRCEGEAEANRVYPQMEGKKIPKHNEDIASEIEKAICRLVFGHKGWTKDSEIITIVNASYPRGRHKLEIELKRCLPEILEKYCLAKVRVNKQTKQRFGIAGNGYPIIIVAEGFNPC